MRRLLSLVIAFLMFSVVLLPKGVMAEGTVVNLITPATIVFDTNNPADVTITIKDGETLSDIKAGTASLIKGIDYTVTGNTVKISKGYYQYLFGKWPTCTSSLTFVMVSGNSAVLKATAIATPKLITPDTITFDINNPTDASITIKDGETLADIKAGTASLTKGVDYTVTGNIVKISKGYYQYIFGKWPACTSNLTFIMVSGNTATLKATATASTVSQFITPSIITFDMNNPADVSITIKDGETLSDIKAGTASLAKGTDYTVIGNMVKISKGYYQYIFGKWPSCISNLTFIMASGNTSNLKATAVFKLLTPDTAQFDMNSTSGISITINNGETLADIKSGTASLTKGTDYTVSGNVVTINSYLRYIFGKWPDVTCNLTFVMVSGNTATLKVTRKTAVEPLISPSAIQFDMSNPYGINITIKNGETLTDVKSGSSSLKKGTDYTISGNVVTINGYFRYIFGKWPNVTCNLTFIAASGNYAYLQATKKQAINKGIVTPGAIVFDINNPSDVGVTIKEGETLSSIKAGTVSLIKGIDYSVSGNTVKISKDYFRYVFTKWPGTTCNVNFAMASGNTDTIEVASTVAVQSPLISPMSDSLNNKEIEYIAVTVALNGFTLSSITNGSNTLNAGTDYIFNITQNSSSVLLSKDYLSKLAAGSYTLTFNFAGSRAVSVNYILTVNDTVVDSSFVVPQEVTYDKNAPEDQNIGLTINKEALNSISSDYYVLKADKDYILEDNKVVLKSDYLACLNSYTILDFISTDGKTSYLMIKIIPKTLEQGFTAEVGSIESAGGSYITIPVTLSKVPGTGLACMGFTLQYDPNYFETETSFEAGPACTVPETNLDVNFKDNKVIVNFIDDTAGSCPIKNDEVLLNLKLKLKSGVTGQTKITVSDPGKAADADLNIYNAKWLGGTITIK